MILASIPSIQHATMLHMTRIASDARRYAELHSNAGMCVRKGATCVSMMAIIYLYVKKAVPELLHAGMSAMPNAMNIPLVSRHRSMSL